MKNLIYLLSVCFLLQGTKLNAHSGGHYHKGDALILNTWTLQSGETIIGNFSFTKDDKIFLEQEDGIIKSILFNDLMIQDQQLAKIKINNLSKVNYSNLNESNSVNNDQFKLAPLLFFAFWY